MYRSIDNTNLSKYDHPKSGRTSFLGLLCIHFVMTTMIILPLFPSNAVDASLTPNAVLSRHRRRIPPQAVVVGAGPAGLSTALILAKKHGYQVTVLERLTKQSLTDPNRSYSYSINFRGQALTKKFPKDIHEAVVEHGVASTKFSAVRIPGDPNVLFDSNKSMVMDLDCGTYYHISRANFLKILLDAVRKEPRIQIKWGQTLQNLIPTILSIQERDTQNDCGVVLEVTSMNTPDTSSGQLKEKLQSHSSPKSNKMLKFTASLVIGADGINSQVRETLASTSFWSNVDSNNDRNPMASKFQIRKWKSPAYGLRAKTIQMNPDIQVPVGNGTLFEIPFNSPVVYAIESANEKPNSRVSLVGFPSDPTPKRPFVICTRPDHDIWQIKTGREMHAWFVSSFPRFQFSPYETNSQRTKQKTKNTSLLDDSMEWDRFAQSEGVRLPHCQVCPSMACVLTTSSSNNNKIITNIKMDDNGSNGNHNNQNNCAVVLVGDSVHSFPPDLGEGLNCALGDVAALDDALTKQNGDLVAALSEYEKERLPEAKALVRMSRVAAPFQYEQARGLIQKIRVMLWLFNVLLRSLLHKLSFGLVPEAVISHKRSRVGITYQKAMRDADVTTACLWSVLIATIVWFLKG